jgi:hypothetical protein
MQNTYSEVLLYGTTGVIERTGGGQSTINGDLRTPGEVANLAVDYRRE